MNLEPRGHEKIVKLMQKGAVIPNPLTLDIGDDVDPDRISGEGVVLHPGCRIHGSGTAIGPGSRIGQEGPVTIESCQIGSNVSLAGGSFRESVFLDGVSVGLGAQVRECCLLEEQSGGAHCVGLKQTILFPFVTLGSLINFCDCLMAGGTSRKDHSEVGSSYIHFNFTPDGDKATASLIGDVPRGVMLNRTRIFLGGQGGLVGPVRLGYGNVVAAGTILRNDVLEENRLVVGKTHRSSTLEYVPRSHRQLSRIAGNNILYLGNLVALENWYVHVRRFFFEAQPMGGHIYEGALDVIRRAKEERIKRLGFVADGAARSRGPGDGEENLAAARQLKERFSGLGDLFRDTAASARTEQSGSGFLQDFHRMREETEGGYVRVVQGMPAALSKKGTAWLEGIVSELCRKASDLLPALELFRKR
jgi:bifunctional UDP-N-acetylglucosamine pyrophosphorylase/glucosamine-1-phosphate N-acetyltransferase